jgi:hypothetical protein
MVTNLDSLTDHRRSLLHDRFPEAKCYPEIDCEVDPLLWSDLDLQLNHFECCFRDGERKELLQLLYRKVNYVRKDGEPGYWNNQRAWNNYDARATMLALSDYEKRESFCRCGYARKDGKSSACGDILFCPRCCFNLRTSPVLEEYGECFGADREVYFITISLSRDARESGRLIFKDLTKSDMEQIKHGVLADPADSRGLRFVHPEDYIACQGYWEIQKQIIERAIKKGWLSGAVGAPEIAGRLGPLSVLPHRHYVAFSPGLSADRVREMRRWMKALIRQSRRISDKMQPSLAVYRITTKDDYEAVLKYCFKPIAIEQAYDVAVATSHRTPNFLHRLNYETNLFLDGIDLVFASTWTLDRRGICSTSSADYCGHVTPERMKKRVKERKRWPRRKAENAARDKSEALQKQARKGEWKRRRTDEAFVTHAHYLRLVRSGDIPTSKKGSFRRRTRKAGVPAPSVSQTENPNPTEIQPSKTPVGVMSSKLREVIHRLFAAAPPTTQQRATTEKDAADAHTCSISKLQEPQAGVR